MTKKPNEDRPPILGSWKNIYLFVMANLVIFIIIFYAITIYFS